MKIQFQADADFNAEIVLALWRREPRIDFQTAEEANLRGVPDLEVLALAAQEQRILVTHDRRTVPRHFADFLIQHQSPGVFIVAQNVSVRAAIEVLRNTKEGIADLFMLIACGLHNLRVRYRKRRLKL